MAHAAKNTMISQAEAGNRGIGLPATGPTGAEYWEKRLARWPGLEGVGYTGLGLPYNQWQYRLRKRIFLRNMLSMGVHFRQSAVLDVGSGTGFWLEAWRSLGVRRLTGSDITSVATNNLRTRFPDVRIVKLDISAPDIADPGDTQYDIVSAFDMLYHITSDRGFASALENVDRLLKPNGFFVFTENMVHKEVPRYPNQVNRTIEAITEELERRRLKIVRRVPMFVLMNNPIDTASEVPRTVWRALMAPVRRFPSIGAIYGTLLFPIDLLLTKICREGPSTELVITRKC